MNLPLLIGSLAGVLGLAAAAWLLGLGGATIDDEAEAIRLAEDSDAGFVAARAVRGADGRAALVIGADDSLMLLKVHGARIAARHLAKPVTSATETNALRIASGDRRFGEVRIAIDDPARRDALADDLGRHAHG